MLQTDKRLVHAKAVHHRVCLHRGRFPAGLILKGCHILQTIIFIVLALRTGGVDASVLYDKSQIVQIL